MEKKRTPRERLRWFLDFPGFERDHWWDKDAWKPFLEGGKAGEGAAILRQWLRAAIAWEVLRRHPATRNLLEDYAREYDAEKQELPPVAVAAIQENPANLLKVWLACFGRRSWGSLGEIMASAVRTALAAASENALQQIKREPAGVDRGIRRSPVRDLFIESVKSVCIIHEPRHKRGVPLIFWDPKFVRPKTKEEREQLPTKIDIEMRQRMSETRAEGWTIIPLAVAPGTSESEFMDAARASFNFQFPKAGAPRIRREPLSIISKFETGKLIRASAYGKEVPDLRPFRKLMQEFSAAYGFPEP